MNFFLSGYFGYANAGDEAVLAAMLEALTSQHSDATFSVTAGDVAATNARFGAQRATAIPRQSFGALAAKIRACDVFLSGGGSLLQDVTSLRNAVYYTALLRFARLARKPTMIYAQGIGPLIRPLSQKLTRIAVQHARAATVRDEASAALLKQIGVRRNVEVTADPVWALSPEPLGETRRDVWLAGLRPWNGDGFDLKSSETIQSWHNATANQSVRFVPMQPGADDEIMRPFVRPHDELVEGNLHPRAVMAQCGAGEAMIAMRLHALIFAAAQGVPCVAINYDPKVKALAHIIGAPLLENLSAAELGRLPGCVANAKPLSEAKRAELKAAALRNAEIAANL
ncbi:MAG TPA: polysaccharide pyruvyl transferase CsaB [Abditibacteriaceae bacterium]|jgi:polysaccharide pyruvyl transferase CsaB